MAITAAQIQGKQLSLELRNIAVKVNAGTATAAEIQQTNISMAEKALLAATLAGTATRQQIEGALVDQPLKDVCLAIRGV